MAKNGHKRKNKTKTKTQRTGDEYSAFEKAIYPAYLLLKNSAQITLTAPGLIYDQVKRAYPAERLFIAMIRTTN